MTVAAVPGVAVATAIFPARSVAMATDPAGEILWMEAGTARSSPLGSAGMALQGFSHVGVCCSDLERSTRFYVDVLGFRELFTVELGPEVAPTMEVDGRFRSRLLARDDLRLELLCWIHPPAQGDGERHPMDRLGMTHLCFRVDDVDTLGELVAAAERAGGTVHPATRSVQDGMGVGGGPVKTMYLTDPDGVRVEVMSGTPDLGAL